jgi:phage shock protein A
MKFLDRVSRLVKSDAHGIIEQLEERGLLLKQHLRDAEIEVGNKRVRVEALEEDQRRLREEAERLQARERGLDEDVELALAGDKQDLARFAVARLLPVREARRDLETRIAEVAAERERLGERLQDQEAQLDELRERVEARLAQVRHERSATPAPERRVADEEIELELLRRGATATSGGSA